MADQSSGYAKLVTAHHFVRRQREGRLRVKRQDAAVASKAVICTAEVNTSDAILLECRGTHHTRFHGYIQVGRLQYGFWMALKYFCDGEEFGVSRSLVVTSEDSSNPASTTGSETYIHRSIGVIHSGSHDLSIMNEDTTDGGFTRL